MTRKITAKVPGPLPISFKDFAKNPVVGTMFLVIVGISALYVDIRGTFKEQIGNQEIKIEKLETRVDMLSNQLRITDSSLSAASSKLNVLQSLGKIPK